MSHTFEITYTVEMDFEDAMEVYDVLKELIDLAKSRKGRILRMEFEEMDD